MARFSFRGAERATGESVGAIQNALGRGDLESLEKNKVWIWAYGRASRRDVLDAQREIYRLWINAIIDIKAAKDAGPEDVEDYARSRLLRFAVSVHELDDKTKYSFSEAFFAGDIEFEVAFNNQGEDLTDIRDRFLFALWNFARVEFGLFCQTYPGFHAIGWWEVVEEFYPWLAKFALTAAIAGGDGRSDTDADG